MFNNNVINQFNSIIGDISQIFNDAAGDANLILGNIQFGHLEVPENFNFGTSQITYTHQLVGGARIIDSIGQSPHNIGWSGMFFGENASDRARYLDYLAAQGSQVQLSFGEFNYTVIVQSFSGQFERFYQVPYTINLLVVQNLSLPVSTVLPNGYNNALENDLINLLNQAGFVNDAALTNSLLSISNSIDAAGDLASATSQQINDIQANIGNSQAIVQQLISANGG